MAIIIARRKFLAALGAAAAARPLAARAQLPGGIRRIGVLMNGAATETDAQSFLAAFLQGLRRLGWTEGQNIRIDVRWSAGNVELAQTYSAQLIGLMPDVILASSTTNLTVVQQATSSVPIVFVSVTDPVAQGFVPSLTHPGGNLTGFSNNEFSIGGKWLDLLKKAAPGIKQVAVMFNPETSPQSKFFMGSIEAAASSLGVRAVAVSVRTTADIEPAVEGFARQPNGGLLLPTDSFIKLRLKLIADLAVSNRLPSISPYPNFVKDRGLLCYGFTINLVDQFRQAATYVDRILKGEKPGDLPIQLADKYTFAINLKTAKALGLTLPSGLLAIADEVIE
jgi:putative ABC transport system substrate-binding protein